MYKIVCSKAVNQRRMLKRYQMNAMFLEWESFSDCAFS